MKKNVSCLGTEEVGSSVPLSLEQSQFDSGRARQLRSPRGMPLNNAQFTAWHNLD